MNRLFTIVFLHIRQGFVPVATVLQSSALSLRRFVEAVIVSVCCSSAPSSVDAYLSFVSGDFVSSVLSLRYSLYFIVRCLYLVAPFYSIDVVQFVCLVCVVAFMRRYSSIAFRRRHLRCRSSTMIHLTMLTLCSCRCHVFAHDLCQIIEHYEAFVDLSSVMDRTFFVVVCRPILT